MVGPYHHTCFVGRLSGQRERLPFPHRACKSCTHVPQQTRGNIFAHFRDRISRTILLAGFPLCEPAHLCPTSHGKSSSAPCGLAYDTGSLLLCSRVCLWSRYSAPCSLLRTVTARTWRVDWSREDLEAIKCHPRGCVKFLLSCMDGSDA